MSTPEKNPMAGGIEFAEQLNRRLEDGSLRQVLLNPDTPDSLRVPLRYGL